MDVVEDDGTLMRFGQADDASAGSKLRPRHGQIFIHDETFWLRVFVSYDIGCKLLTRVSRNWKSSPMTLSLTTVSEAYLNGEVDSPDLTELFHARIAPLSLLQGRSRLTTLPDLYRQLPALRSIFYAAAPCAR